MTHGVTINGDRALSWCAVTPAGGGLLALSCRLRVERLP
jgi:hypothetical protein